jgi:superfamily II DNA or RNA helicase
MSTITFEPGQRVRIPNRTDIEGFVKIEDALRRESGWRLYVSLEDGSVKPIDLKPDEAAAAEVLDADGAGDSAAALAGLWTEWMRSASLQASSTILASSPLRPYAHQTNAVYGAMLPQPRLRFLLADEPGTGKTIMAGMYLREMRRLGLINRALVVAPAHLVGKWQRDFERFFGGGLRRITSQTIHEGALSAPHDLWIVSLDLAGVNPSVQEAIRPDIAGWDVVVFDEAHRLTPTAVSYYRTGRLLSTGTPRALFMTATPHRGKEWLFRALMHLVDPEVYPEIDADDGVTAPIKPARMHFLRRMKEQLLDYDGKTKLFKGRHASNIAVSLNSIEAAYYGEAQDLVDRYFPPAAVPLAQLVYGKRAASSLWALAETLRRRRAAMGTQTPAAAALAADPYDDDETVADEARVVVEASKSAKAERSEIDALLARLDPLLRDPAMPVSKWGPLVKSLADNGISPGTSDQAVIFTEYADTADWLVKKMRSEGYTAERYSGRDDHAAREAARVRFEQRGFQVLVSTDAGNEGIDLQTAHVLVNYDIPWSLVRLEQRMGRIHRVGQTRDVELINLVAVDTREGEVLHVLLENFVTAANRLEGKLFDSLSLVADLVNLDVEKLLADTYADDDRRAAALAAVRAVTAAQLEATARKANELEAELASTVDIASAVAALNDDLLTRINPAIVNAYLKRLAEAQVITLSPHGAGDGLHAIGLSDGRPLPASFDPSARFDGATARSTSAKPTSCVIATSSAALSAARLAGATIPNAISLGPGEQAFRSLVELSARELAPSLFRGSAVLDEASITDYDLFSFEATVSEAVGKRKSVWCCLVRVDATGARGIRWEALANLRASVEHAGSPHPSRIHDATAAAGQLAQREQRNRSTALDAWLRTAERELARLPDAMTEAMKPHDRRIVERKRLEEMTKRRLSDLRAMAEVAVTGVRQVGWVHVKAAGSPLDPVQADSEMIAMRATTALLRDDGWAVADVHTEDRGYDLYATRGKSQRCVEVKGVWGKASSDGISMTSTEILIATQLASTYWLYVVDGCADGSGTLYGTYSNPVATFAGLVRDVTSTSVPGSALKAAREKGAATCA